MGGSSANRAAGAAKGWACPPKSLTTVRDHGDRPYWIGPVQRRRARTRTAARRTADVVVAGGGIAGVAVAYWLAKRGARVDLVEARQLCFGATGRNVGLFLPNASALEDPDLVEAVLAEEGIDAGFSKVGHLALTRSPDIWERIGREVRARPVDRAPLEALDRRDCERLLDRELAADIIGGRWYAAGRVIDPVRFTLGFARAASRYGARISEWEPVREIASTSHAYEVRTTRSVISTGQVVLACNAWTRRLVPVLASVLRPVPAQVLATASGSRGPAMGLALDWGTIYWRHLPDGVTLAGGLRSLDRPEDSDCSLDVDASVQDAVANSIADILPGQPLPPVQSRWAGIMDETPDGRPVIGRLSDHSPWIVAGFGGHGLPPALAVARYVATGLATNTIPSEIEALRIGRFDRLLSASACADAATRSAIVADEGARSLL